LSHSAREGRDKNDLEADAEVEKSDDCRFPNVDSDDVGLENGDDAEETGLSVSDS